MTSEVIENTERDASLEDDDADPIISSSTTSNIESWLQQLVVDATTTTAPPLEDAMVTTVTTGGGGGGGGGGGTHTAQAAVATEVDITVTMKHDSSHVDEMKHQTPCAPATTAKHEAEKQEDGERNKNVVVVVQQVEAAAAATLSAASSFVEEQLLCGEQETVEETMTTAKDAQEENEEDHQRKEEVPLLVQEHDATPATPSNDSNTEQQQQQQKTQQPAVTNVVAVTPESKSSSSSTTEETPMIARALADELQQQMRATNDLRLVDTSISPSGGVMMVPQQHEFNKDESQNATSILAAVAVAVVSPETTTSVDAEDVVDVVLATEEEEQQEATKSSALPTTLENDTVCTPSRVNANRTSATPVSPSRFSKYSYMNSIAENQSKSTTSASSSPTTSSPSRNAKKFQVSNTNSRIQDHPFFKRKLEDEDLSVHSADTSDNHGFHHDDDQDNDAAANENYVNSSHFDDIVSCPQARHLHRREYDYGNLVSGARAAQQKQQSVQQELLLLQQQSIVSSEHGKLNRNSSARRDGRIMYNIESGRNKSMSAKEKILFASFLPQRNPRRSHRKSSRNQHNHGRKNNMNNNKSLGNSSRLQQQPLTVAAAASAVRCYHDVPPVASITTTSMKAPSSAHANAANSSIPNLVTSMSDDTASSLEETDPTSSALACPATVERGGVSPVAAAASASATMMLTPEDDYENQENSKLFCPAVGQEESQALPPTTPQVDDRDDLDHDNINDDDYEDDADLRPTETPTPFLYIWLLAPECKIFEVVKVSYNPSETTIGQVLGKARDAATDPVLADQHYVSLCNDEHEFVAPMLPISFLLNSGDKMDRGGGGNNNKTIFSGSSNKPSLSVTPTIMAVPDGSTAIIVRHIRNVLMQNPRIARWLQQQDIFQPTKSSSSKKKSSSKSKSSSLNHHHRKSGKSCKSKNEDGKGRSRSSDQKQQPRRDDKLASTISAGSNDNPSIINNGRIDDVTATTTTPVAITTSNNTLNILGEESFSSVEIFC
jgi:hypothetical protein